MVLWLSMEHFILGIKLASLHLWQPSSPHLHPEGSLDLLALPPPRLCSLCPLAPHHWSPHRAQTPGSHPSETVAHHFIGNPLPSFSPSPQHLSPPGRCCILFLYHIYFLSPLPACQGQEGSTFPLLTPLIFLQHPVIVPGM